MQSKIKALNSEAFTKKKLWLVRKKSYEYLNESIEKLNNLTIENNDEMFKSIYDPTVFEFNEIMTDRIDFDDFKISPVPFEY